MQDDELARAVYARWRANGLVVQPLARVLAAPHTASRTILLLALKNVRPEFRERAALAVRQMLRIQNPAASLSNVSVRLVTGPTAHVTLRRQGAIVHTSLQQSAESMPSPIEILLTMHHWPHNENVQFAGCFAMVNYLSELDSRQLGSRARELGQFAAVEALTGALELQRRHNKKQALLASTACAAVVRFAKAGVIRKWPDGLADAVLAVALEGTLDYAPGLLLEALQACTTMGSSESKPVGAKITELAGCMRRFHKDSEVLSAGLALLELMAQTAPANAAIAMAQITTAALRAQPASATVLAVAANVVRSWLLKGRELAAADLETLLAEGLLLAIHKAMETQPTEHYQARLVCSLVANLATGTPQQYALVRHGAVALITSIMDRHAHDPCIQNEALFAFGNLTGTSRGWALEPVASGGGIRTALAAMKSFPADADLLITAMISLGNMADHDPTQPVMAAAGGIDAAFTALQAFPKNTLSCKALESGCWQFFATTPATKSPWPHVVESRLHLLPSKNAPPR